MEDASRDRQIAIWVAIGVVVHLTAAWFSLGSHHVDEHFQILEFLNYKLGGTPGSALPWEFPAHIRPWIQIWFMLGIVRFDHAFGITDPIAIERTFRLLFSVLGLASGLLLATNARPLLRNERSYRWLIIAQVLYWPLVYMHARISSEALGTTLLLFGLCATLAKSKRLYLTAIGGCLLGFALMVRFQLAFSVAGLAAYLVLIERGQARRLLVWIAALAFAMAVGVACDAWGYGEIVFTPLRYFKANILEGRATHWGVHPVWWYFPKIILWLLPPFSLMILGGAGWFFLTLRKHAFTWVTLPLLLGHMAVSHKETRFLFPLLPFAPIFFLTLVERLGAAKSAALRAVAGRATGAYAVCGAIVLAPMTFRPPTLQTRYWLYVHDVIGDNYAPLWWHLEPMELAKLPVYYYRPRNYKPQRIHSFAELAARSSTAEVMFYWDDVELPADAGALNGRCRRIFCTVPELALRYHVDRIIDDDAKQALFMCGPDKLNVQ